MKAIFLHILLLTSSATVDAWTTNNRFHQWQHIGGWGTEYNPAVKPFAGKPALYVVMPAGDLAIYFGLRLSKHRKLARDYALAQAGVHVGLAVWNLKHGPPGNEVVTAKGEP
jgi:hypothetical protein